MVVVVLGVMGMSWVGVVVFLLLEGGRLWMRHDLGVWVRRIETRGVRVCGAGMCLLKQWWIGVLFRLGCLCRCMVRWWGEWGEWWIGVLCCLGRCMAGLWRRFRAGGKVFEDKEV